MVEIQSLASDVPSLNFLVYADSGAGKTVFAGSAPRVLFIAPEDTGTLSAVRMGSTADKIKVKNWGDFVEAYEYCYDNIDEIKKNYDWLVIDSTTEMQAMCLRALIADARQERIQKDQDPDQPQIQDYGKLYILMEKMILAFNDLPVNVLYTALARNAEDPDGNEFMLPMLGSNKPTDYRISMKVAAQMTSYGYLKVEIVEKPIPGQEGKTKRVKQRSITWEDTGVIRGKDRTTRLQPKTILPSKGALDYITKLANGEIDKDGKLAGVSLKAPAKKTAAKKAPVKKAAQANPANTKDDAADISDSVPQHDSEGDSNDIELTSVEA